MSSLHYLLPQSRKRLRLLLIAVIVKRHARAGGKFLDFEVFVRSAILRFSKFLLYVKKMVRLLPRVSQRVDEQ